MAFTIEMLVKGGFLRSTREQGYDGDAAELVHISTDGVAVVALVHNGAAAFFKVSRQEGFALVEVRHVRCGDDEAKRVAQGIARQMDFGRKAGLRAPHRLGDLAAGRTGRVLMNPRN